MVVQIKSESKPFLKWVGGKGRLLSQLMPLFPDKFTAYYEPFFGGGAVFFALDPNLGHINDINKNLINAYIDVRDNVENVIQFLKKIEIEYLLLDSEKRAEYFYGKREEYNDAPFSIRKTVLLIFLNKTCFNGLYRENRSGKFNVPFGRYANPKICDEENLRLTSKSLQNVQITSSSFAEAVKEAKKGDFVYLDPPYHPLSTTSSFTSYSENDFTESDQRKLKSLFDILNKRGCKVALSNSDCKFIRDLYSEYRQEKVYAGRSINAHGHKRGKITELVVLNY